MDPSSLLQLIDALQKGSNGGSNPLFDIIRKLLSGGGFNALSGGKGMGGGGTSNPLASMFGGATSEPMQNGGPMAANAFRTMLDPNRPQQDGWQGGGSPFNALGAMRPALQAFGMGGGGIYPSGNQMQ